MGGPGSSNFGSTIKSPSIDLRPTECSGDWIGGPSIVFDKKGNAIGSCLAFSNLALIRLPKTRLPTPVPGFSL